VSTGELARAAGVGLSLARRELGMLGDAGRAAADRPEPRRAICAAMRPAALGAYIGRQGI